jgi:methyltransferase-like protein
MLQPMRDAFMAALPEGVDMLARVANARKLLEFLAETTPDTGPYGETLRAWAKRFPNLPDDYIAHDFLEECNNPVMVSQFAASANQYGLGFLAECELQAMILDNYEAKVAEGIRARGGNDLVASEQMLDWLTGRTFRQTLLVSRERMASINRALTADSLAGLHFVLPNGAKVERDGDKTSLCLPNGRSINSGNAEVGAMLDAMVLAMPGSSAHDDLLGTAQGETRAALSEALYRMVITGMVQVASEADVCLNSASEKPLASALVRSDVEAGAATTTNLRHEPLSIDPAARIALPMLDGETSRKAIITKLIKEAKAGKITYAKDGAEITDPAKLKVVVEEHLEGMLTNLAAAALLEA